MSFHLRTSYHQSVGVAPVVVMPITTAAAAATPTTTTPTPQTYYASPPPPTAAPQHIPAAAAVQHHPITPRNSLHQRLPTNGSGYESALDALNALDFSERALDFSRRITSDISTLECESVKAEPNYNPAVEDTPFVPPLEIHIPVNLAHLAVQQKQQQQKKLQQSNHGSTTTTTTTTARRASFSSANLLKPAILTRQTSCQSRLEMSQASPNKSSLHYISHKSAMKLAMNNGGVLPPQYSHSSGTVPQEELDRDPSLEDYANGAGAVTWDDHSRLSYYTSPTDLYTSDDSDPIAISNNASNTATKKGKVKRELKKIMTRFRHSKSKHKSKTLQPQEVVEGAIKDYDSFGSERGFC
ncbi:unnamed protein product [Cylindrotheca closterium]|uniref:Uncharacterized protein n=1 Tax=Cylindrotheca closterium TaxID=2856 RepID=A0AAD2JGD0_9STRA|nr:unnamed protein product [Cylindrotheca closterium]